MRGKWAWMAGVGLAVALAAPMQAPAQSAVTAQDAAIVERDLRAWVAGLLAPLVDPAAVPVRVQPSGEGFRLEIGMVALPGLSITPEIAVAALLRPQSGGRWSLDDLRLPTALTVAQNDKKLFAMSIGTQQARGEFDPSLRTPSRFEGRYADVVEEIASPQGPSSTRMATVEYAGTWEPAGEGQIDTADRMRISGYTMEQTLPDGQALRLAAREVTATTKGVGVSPANTASAIRAIAALVGDVIATRDSARGPTAGQRKLMHSVLDSLGGLFIRLETEQTWSGLTVATDGGSGQLDKISLATRMAAPGGKAEVALRLELAGLTTALLPQGPIRQLMPRRIAIAPRLTGLPKSEVLALLGRAIDSAGSSDADLAGDAMALLADNPAVIALDDLDIDVGIARLRGSGEFNIAAADDMSGELELRMTGLDALLRTLRQVPEAAAAAPVLLMLKGLGEASGNETVWRIEYADHKVTVNGTDLSDMIPRK
ncbi:MAG: DUF2125 domain-containing protein [Alphaproteobacteria bacterium]|nr:DUF2125 domain-containing protein [Alphaproteobacteria bacterium]